MFKINKMTDYAVVCLSMLARNPGSSMSATELSKSSGLTLYTVQKLLKILSVKSSFVTAQRGVYGGYVLNRESSKISLIEIIEALDGPISLTACVDSSQSMCETSKICFLVGKWNKVNQIIRNSLNDITLDDLLNYEEAFPIQDENETELSAIN